MRIAYTTTADANNVHYWSGTPFYMSRGFINANVSVDFIGNLQRKLPPLFKVKRFFKKHIANVRETPRFNTFAAKNYSQQAAQQLANLSVDAIVSPLINPIAFLDCKQPIVLWTDAVYSGLTGFYEPFSRHSPESMRQGNEVMSECLKRTSLAIFSSEWAANDALHRYGASREKVKVVPFGANMETFPARDEIEYFISQRCTKTIKLLFLAKCWDRKGGDTVLAVAKALHEAGHPVELTLVGLHPPHLNPVPSYIKSLGYVSKQEVNGRNQIQRLLSESHFLFVPSRAEAFGIVFCEANAFGVPCLTTYVGGISTIVKDNINGMTFALDASVESYCNYIVNLMQDRNRYNEMARASYNEFIQRLNWPVAIAQVKKMIAEVL